MNKHIDYAEKSGVENMRERIEVAGMIQREANTVMTLLLAGPARRWPLPLAHKRSATAALALPSRCAYTFFHSPRS